MSIDFKNGTKKEFCPWCAYVQLCNGVDFVDGGMVVDFRSVSAFIDFEKLIEAKDVKTLTEKFYSMIKVENKEGEEIQAFTIDKDGMLWDEAENGSVKDITKITIYDREESDYGDGLYGEKVIYDAITKTFTSECYGEAFYVEDSTSGNFDVYYRKR
jgi:hypothetical protein